MINQFEVQKRISEFSDRHGRFARVGNWIYHEDGANRDINSLGPLNEPPHDPVQRCRNIVKYRQEVLDRMVREFDVLKRKLKEDASGWADEEENVKRLVRLRRMVRLRQKQLAEAQDNLQRAMPGPSPERERILRQSEAATEDARNRYRNRIDGIHI